MICFSNRYLLNFLHATWCTNQPKVPENWFHSYFPENPFRVHFLHDLLGDHARFHTCVPFNHIVVLFYTHPMRACRLIQVLVVVEKIRSLAFHERIPKRAPFLTRISIYHRRIKSYRKTDWRYNFFVAQFPPKAFSFRIWRKHLNHDCSPFSFEARA